MKVIGSSATGGVLVELSTAEWVSIGGKTYVSGYTTHPCTKGIPDIRGLVDALISIRNASPDLARLRATFQSFLMLTEPESITETLRKCGCADPVVEPEDDVVVVDEE